MINQLPFVGVEFVDNPEPRCPCVLLLDTSGSMRGQAIAALNQGVELLAEELNADSLARERIELAVITFGDEVQVIQDFVSPAAFMPPRFEADGNTPMGRAVLAGCEVLEERKHAYQSAGVNYFRPWMFLITDGEPTDYNTDMWRKAVELSRQAEASRSFIFYGVAVNDANQSKLNELCPPHRPAQKLRGLNFGELFSWLSCSLRSVSLVNPGVARPVLPPITDWALLKV